MQRQQYVETASALVETPLSNRESAREHCWGSEHPISVLSGRQPATTPPDLCRPILSKICSRTVMGCLAPPRGTLSQTLSTSLGAAKERKLRFPFTEGGTKQPIRAQKRRRGNPSATSRCSNLVPSRSADARSTDDVFAFEGPLGQTLGTSRRYQKREVGIVRVAKLR